MLVRWRAALCCVIVAAAQSVHAAQEPVQSSAPLQPAITSPPVEADPAPGFLRLPAGTIVDFEIADALSSKTSKIDEMFAIKLSEPVSIGGVTMLPVGTTGKGQVVHAAKARALGKAGELILAARFLSCGDTHIALRGFHLGRSGKNKATELTAAIVTVGLVALPLAFVSGGESIIPTGTHANARLGSAVDIRATSDGSCVAQPVANTLKPPPAAATGVAAAPVQP